MVFVFGVGDQQIFSKLWDSIEESFPKHDRLMKAEAAVSVEGTA